MSKSINHSAVVLCGLKVAQCNTNSDTITLSQGPIADNGCSLIADRTGQDARVLEALIAPTREIKPLGYNPCGDNNRVCLNLQFFDINR
ncbi:hypothetical protein SUGI_0371570 [Cryptomeria japonica]|nr:hypothetical protein SUGI_0371570 [Cryptomeria japonica]